MEAKVPGRASMSKVRNGETSEKPCRKKSAEENVCDS